MAQLFDARGNEFAGNLDVITGQVLTDARSSFVNLAALNAEALFDLNGHSSILVDVRGTFTATAALEGTIDGTNYFTIPVFNIQTQAYVASWTAAIQGVASVAGYRRVRVRVTAYTSGTLVVAGRATVADAFVQVDRLALTQFPTATAASGAAVTLTLPAVAGLAHYIDSIRIEHFAAATLTAAAAPVVVTTTNIPNTPSFNFRADATPQGTLTPRDITFASPVRSTAVNTATTVVCPATANVIWRVSAAYRLGL